MCIRDRDTSLLQSDLDEINAELSLACQDTRSNCPVEDSGVGSDADGTSSAIEGNVVYIVIGVLVVCALLGVMMMRRGGQEEIQVWDQGTLPAHDQTANSMYGGAGDLFQKPLVPIHQPQAAMPMPPAPPMASAGPPLPPGGLPAGWTMEQWQYYGQQYLDSINQF